jgi:hypothetical protein
MPWTDTARAASQAVRGSGAKSAVPTKSAKATTTAHAAVGSTNVAAAKTATAKAAANYAAHNPAVGAVKQQAAEAHVAVATHNAQMRTAAVAMKAGVTAMNVSAHPKTPHAPVQAIHPNKNYHFVKPPTATTKSAGAKTAPKATGSYHAPLSTHGSMRAARYPGNYSSKRGYNANPTFGKAAPAPKKV